MSSKEEVTPTDLHEALLDIAQTLEIINERLNEISAMIRAYTNYDEDDNLPSRGPF